MTFYYSIDRVCLVDHVDLFFFFNFYINFF